MNRIFINYNESIFVVYSFIKLNILDILWMIIKIVIKVELLNCYCLIWYFCYLYLIIICILNYEWFVYIDIFYVFKIISVFSLN